MDQAKNQFTALANDMDDLARYGIEEAKRKGVESLQVTTDLKQEKRLVVESGAFSLANSTTTQDIHLTVHHEKRRGSASTNILAKANIDNALSTAIGMANFSVKDDALIFADSKIAPKAKSLDFLYDEALAEMELKELKDVMKDVLAILTKDKRVALDRLEMEISTSRDSLMNSRGVSQSELQTTVSWDFFAMARDGDEVSGFDYDDGFSFSKGFFREEAMHHAELFAKKIVKNLYPKKCTTYKGPVVFSPRAISDIFLNNWLYHMDGRQIMDGKSRWEKSIGEKVLSSKISIFDNPHDRRLIGATSYDSDGLPTKINPLLDKGVLQQHLHDCYSANRMGVASNSVAGGPFGLSIDVGTSSFERMIKDYKEILFVDRFSGNGDPITGDFSGVAKSSRLFINGEDTGPVMETSIAGNTFDLADEILSISDTAEIVGGYAHIPTMVVDGVSVHG